MLSRRIAFTGYFNLRGAVSPCRGGVRVRERVRMRVRERERVRARVLTLRQPVERP